MEPRSFDGVVWRVTWATRDPLAGGTGGGRWHPPNDFEALYTSLEESGEYRNITNLNWKMAMGDNRNLAMKIGLSNEYDSLAAPGTETNDFKYNLSLVWAL